MKTPFSRRRFIKTSTLAAGAGLTMENWLSTVAADTPSASNESTAHAAPGEVSLRLLDEKPLSIDSGVSFGVPWPQGSIKRDAKFSLTSDGKQLPLQTWPLAYWPDGSLKWSGFATVVPAGVTAPFILSPGA